jgi:hypothetical protein
MASDSSKIGQPAQTLITATGWIGLPSMLGITPFDESFLSGI